MRQDTIEITHAATQQSASASVLVRTAGVVGFTAATALSAQIAIPLPGTPVPITLQTAVVLLAGVTLGARLGTASMALYLLLGAVGYHAFALGNWGLATVFGATGGYLLGFLLAQPVLGVLTRSPATRGEPSGPTRAWLRLLIALLTGHAIVFGVGLPWLAVAMSYDSIATTLARGFLPFVPGMVAKTLLALAVGATIAPRARAFFDPPR